jgi:hypothetical protein
VSQGGLEGGNILNNTLNLYDIIQFPNSEIRKNLRKKYFAFAELKQITVNIDEKYDGTEVPCEFINYGTTVATWIREYNYSIFIMSIPLFEMLYVYESISSDDEKKEQLPYHSFLLNYYCELLAYYIDWAFKKSVNIFNALFELNVNVIDNPKSFSDILKEVRNKSKSNRIINKLELELQQFKSNKYYIDIINIRNLNTHSIRATQSGYLEIYDSKTGGTKGTISVPVKPDEIFTTILEAIKLLGQYSVFIEEIIEEYYDFLYKEYP